MRHLYGGVALSLKSLLFHRLGLLAKRSVIYRQWSSKLLYLSDLNWRKTGNNRLLPDWDWGSWHERNNKTERKKASETELKAKQRRMNSVQMKWNPKQQQQQNKSKWNENKSEITKNNKVPYTRNPSRYIHVCKITSRSWSYLIKASLNTCLLTFIYFFVF